MRRRLTQIGPGLSDSSTWPHCDPDLLSTDTVQQWLPTGHRGLESGIKLALSIVVSNERSGSRYQGTDVGYTSSHPPLGLHPGPLPLQTAHSPSRT